MGTCTAHCCTIIVWQQPAIAARCAALSSVARGGSFRCGVSSFGGRAHHGGASSFFCNAALSWGGWQPRCGDGAARHPFRTSCLAGCRCARLVFRFTTPPFGIYLGALPIEAGEPIPIQVNYDGAPGSLTHSRLFVSRAVGAPSPNVRGGRRVARVEAPICDGRCVG